MNARDAIGQSGTVTISTASVHLERHVPEDGSAGHRPNHYAVISVEDTGAGMDPEVLSHIFEPFYTTKDLGRGTGLGLSTIYGIVKQNHGFIDVASQPGRGSRFSIHLPVVHVLGDDADMKLEREASDTSACSGGRVVLIVEDEPDILKLCRFVLESRGFTVLVASSPLKALCRVREYAGSIDLLLTDVIMPEMNGSELSARLTELHPDVRVLYMSGYTADIVGSHGVSDRSVNFIQKPFSVKELIGKVQEMFRTEA
ncbi:response regulator [Pelodictyon luteolum]|uniref:response regulator n=1 Tax=Pelodictyon luteolum TaxID=1100 RepID=UPI001389E2A4|nr:response regulator [Pelodictyon luteolum]